jgi:hypothetical protein
LRAVSDCKIVKACHRKPQAVAIHECLDCRASLAMLPDSDTQLNPYSYCETSVQREAVAPPLQGRISADVLVVGVRHFMVSAATAWYSPAWPGSCWGWHYRHYRL